jgi:predicted kinase
MSDTHYIKGSDGKMNGSWSEAGKNNIPSASPEPVLPSEVKGSAENQTAIKVLPGAGNLYGKGARMKKQLLILRGLPASGKSTYAKELVAVAPSGTAVRLNNDDYVAMIYGGRAPYGNSAVREFLAKSRLEMLESFLASELINLIIIDNTNLANKTVSGYFELANRYGAEIVIDDRFLKVSVEECIARDANRENPVGEAVILEMATKIPKLHTWTPKEIANLTSSKSKKEDTLSPAKKKAQDLSFVVPYPNDDESLPETIIVDIDGTLALMDGRDPFDWSRVSEDRPNAPVVNYVKYHLAKGNSVIIMSGRKDNCRIDTQLWLDKHVGVGLPLYMRDAKDDRPDSRVKHELFYNHVAGKYRVNIVLDDRNQVVALWRAMGLRCWQVAEGDF